MNVTAPLATPLCRPVHVKRLHTVLCQAGSGCKVNPECLLWPPLYLWHHAHCTKSIQCLFTTCQLEFGAVILLLHHVSCFVSFLITIRSDYFFSSTCLQASFYLAHDSCSTHPDLHTKTEKFTCKKEVSEINSLQIVAIFMLWWLWGPNTYSLVCLWTDV